MCREASRPWKRSGRYDAGVMKYKEMGYFDLDYQPKETDILACFRVTPQDGVDPEDPVGDGDEHRPVARAERRARVRDSASRFHSDVKLSEPPRPY